MESLPDGTRRTSSKLDSLLLNGNHIAMMVPGSSPEDAAAAGLLAQAGPVAAGGMGVGGAMAAAAGAAAGAGTAAVQ